MGRKNFLFCNTPRGAHSSAVIYSIIETAKENNLDPFKYLTWILKTAPYLNLKNAADIDKLLPENAPTDCYSQMNIPYKIEQ
ncbi:MAG: transposase domain-containing protein [Anaerolineaceae bacterium]|nr:transposase domain-containing protein [Anaerolineaceae bacterium]